MLFFFFFFFFLTSQPAGYWVRHVQRERHVSRRGRVLRCDVVGAPRRMRGSGCGVVIVGLGRRRGVVARGQGKNAGRTANERVCMGVRVYVYV